MTNITRKDFAIQMQIRIALMRPRYWQEGDPPLLAGFLCAKGFTV